MIIGYVRELAYLLRLSRDACTLDYRYDAAAPQTPDAQSGDIPNAKE